jgi:hypothetical protein
VNLKVLAVSLPLVALGCATASNPVTPAPPSVPDALVLPAGTTPVLQVFARGTQNYRCEAKAAGGAEWKLVAPDAVLTRTPEAGAPAVGSHGAGPSWTLEDGSGVTGDATKAAKAPSPEPGSIPWLRVPAQANGRPGALLGVNWVQRVDTHGGAAPAAGCDAALVGAETRVPYTATYVFSR